MKRLLLFVSVLILASGVIAYFVVPWNTLLEQRIVSFLEKEGLENIVFKIDRVGLHEATFTDMRIGTEDPLLLQSVTVQYDPRELLDKNLQNLTLTGLDIQLLQTEAGWKIAGLPDVKQKQDGKKSTLSFADIVDLLPFSSIAVKDSYLRITGNAVQASLPFNLTLTKTPETILDLTINASDLTAASSDVSLGVITVKASPDESRGWNGSWFAQSLDFGDSLPVPVLKGEGTLRNRGSATTIEGTLASADKAHKGDFSVVLDTEKTDKNALTLKSATFPFKQGRITAKNTVVPFDRAKNITINLDVRKVSLNELMQTLTGQKVKATGTVSGHIPVILRPDGSYTLGKGVLKADNEGLIQMPASLIPGDHQQVELVRQILENLHYAAFSAAVDTSGKEGLVVRLALEGNNPDVYNGRMVKLNVNLTGDVLDFIQQNAMLITNPEKLLRQGTDE